MQIFLAPRSNETSYRNFLSTIENGVDYKVLTPHLNEEGKNVLAHLGKLYAWGNKETKKSSWEKMNLGDLVLFYKGREKNESEGKLVYAGRLLFKQYSKNLGLALWPPKPRQEPWVCIFFLKDLKPVYIPISVIAEAAGYKKGFVVQGFMPLKREATKKLIQQYGSIEQFLSAHTPGVQHLKPDLEDSGKKSTHTRAQLLLLKIGRMMGYDTYSPDKSATFQGESLRDYITLENIQTRFLGHEVVSHVREIDVIWFKDEVPEFAFEIEHSTKFVSGFQRLCQLHQLSTKLFIISSR